MKNILFITSTIQPDSNVFLLKRSQVEDRLKDYQSAFRFYCSQLRNDVFYKIVYVDNSGYDLLSLKAIAQEFNLTDKVEFVSYKASTNYNKSRFYLEMNLINYGMENSKTCSDHQDAMFWKVTGRYLIKNIHAIISEVKQPYDLYINFRNYPYKVLDFYLVGFLASNFKNTLGKNIEFYDSTEDGELILRRLIEKGAFKQFLVVTRFKHIPKIYGIRGFDNASYSSLANQLKFSFRNVINFLLPSLYL